MTAKENPQKTEEKTLVRILGKDLRGEKKIVSELTKIKGISWSFSNSICKTLKIDPNTKVSESPVEEIEKFMESPRIPKFLKNRQKDFDDGLDKHLTGADLKLRNEFDIKRLKKIRSYKGHRHNLGQPVRGQRTKSHFRTNRRKSGAVGVKKKK
ncbi:MAG: 30S ribosomal protein S13 [Candidatus Pacearchaeota archaeon]